MEQTGVLPEKLNFESRLSFALGIEGDDAAQFFERFQKKFSVDLAELKENGSSYSAPEKVSLVTAPIVLLPALFLGIAFSRLWSALPTWLCWLFGISIGFAGFYRWHLGRRRPTERGMAIAQWVEAAESGRLRLDRTSQENAQAWTGS